MRLVSIACLADSAIMYKWVFEQGMNKGKRSLGMSRLINLPRIAISLAMLPVFASAFTTTAKADPILLVNGGSAVIVTYQSATFVNSNATATFTLNGNILTVQLTNTSTELGDGTILTGLGFDTTPNVTGTYSASGNASLWSFNQGGLGSFEVSAHGQGIGEGIAQGVTNTLTFTLSGLNGANLTIDLTQVHLQSRGDGDGGSEKPTGSTTPTPEPASMLALGTGLAGLASYLRKRRVRKSQGGNFHSFPGSRSHGHVNAVNLNQVCARSLLSAQKTKGHSLRVAFCLVREPFLIGESEPNEHTVTQNNKRASAMDARFY